MIGKPQPLKIPQVEKPSLEQSTTSATRIQIEQLLFCMQQFIKETSCVFSAEVCRVSAVLLLPFALWQLRSFVFLIIVYSCVIKDCDGKFL